MKLRIKELWVSALESGEYQQGVGVLRSIRNEYCCLGVLTDLCAKEKGVDFKDVLFSSDGKFIHEDETLSGMVQEWAGLDSYDPILGDYTASAHNDGIQGLERKDFKEIAALIREHL